MVLKVLYFKKLKPYVNYNTLYICFPFVFIEKRLQSLSSVICNLCGYDVMDSVEYLR